MVYEYAKYKISNISDPSGTKKGHRYPILFLEGAFGNGLDPLCSFLCVPSLVLFWFFLNKNPINYNWVSGKKERERKVVNEENPLTGDF